LLLFPSFTVEEIFYLLFKKEGVIVRLLLSLVRRGRLDELPAELLDKK